MEVTEAISYGNGTVQIDGAFGGSIKTYAKARHPLLEAALPVEAEMLPVWSHQECLMGEGLRNTMTSQYSLVGDVRNPQQTLHTDLLVNGSKVLGIEFDQFTSKESYFDREGTTLLTITFDPAGLPQSFVAPNMFPLNISYDNFNRMDGWIWGPTEEKFTYDRHGLLSEITSGADGTKILTYNEWNVLSKITLGSQRNFLLDFDEDGGLRHVTLPSGTKHSFSMQPSLGFIRMTYTPPGSSRSYLQHYSYSGSLLQTIFPGDGARVVYRYLPNSPYLAECIHGDGKSRFSYSSLTGLPSQVLHTERDLDYRWDYQYQSGLLTEERIDFGAKTGLSNAKFTYEYDSNFRLSGVQGRIGGQGLPGYGLGYNQKTGALEQIGGFKVTKMNGTMVFDGIALFTRGSDARFLETQVALTIHRMEVFRMEFSHDPRGYVVV